LYKAFPIYDNVDLWLSCRKWTHSWVEDRQ